MEICNIMKIVYTHGIKQHGSHVVSGCFPFDQKFWFTLNCWKFTCSGQWNSSFRYFRKRGTPCKVTDFRKFLIGNFLSMWPSPRLNWSNLEFFAFHKFTNFRVTFPENFLTIFKTALFGPISIPFKQFQMLPMQLLPKDLNL